jgi:hypothetical protein
MNLASNESFNGEGVDYAYNGYYDDAANEVEHETGDPADAYGKITGAVSLATAQWVIVVGAIAFLWLCRYVFKSDLKLS